MGNSGSILALLILASALLTPAATGQLPAATVVAMHVDTVEGGVDTSYTVEIGGIRRLAISARRARSLAATEMDLRDALARVRALEADTTALRSFRRQADATVQTAESLIVRLEAQLTDYQRLTDVYRKLAAEEVLSVEGGVGLTDLGDPRGALLAGLGFRHVRLWGFLQKGNSGAAVGMHLRLF
jgi:hypothetical protein